MSQPTEEKRETIRFPYVRPVSYMAMGQFRYASSGDIVQGMILDIGSRGVQILTEVKQLWEATVIRAWIPLPENKITVPVLAYVRWMRQKSREVYVIGLEFMI